MPSQGRQTGKVPKIGKVPALPWLDGLNEAIVAFQENTFAVSLFFQGEPPSIRSQAGEPLNELDFAQSFEGGEASDFTVIQTNLAGPPAAGGAALAFMKDRPASDGSVSVGSDKQPVVERGS